MSAPHVVVKGGVWKNSEDEVLKAAVMKYGKNQWGRVSSLLVRKSAKQCKARWYEWLDPSIKKTEWTRDEEEKLLHLAKLMPTQWRTIAPIIGRTATQCLEHYERLLDRAQAPQDEQPFDPDSLDDATAAAMSDDPRRKRTGEVDPHPETRPARPDPVDMDEDEKEMLSEARARLANTRGKKAKRKQREKQLEEAKRLAQLQKRRELKAAGIRVKGFRAKRGEIDYAREIPFQRAPVAGFYDTTEERKAAKLSNRDARETGKLLQSYDGKSKDEVEQAKRKQDQRRRKAFEKANLPHALNVDKPADEHPIPKRSKLSLPAPQVSDQELEAISKANAVTNSVIAHSAHSLDAPTAHLLPTRHGPPATQPDVRTAGEPWKDVRARQIENLKAFQDTVTPLRGGDNAPIVHPDFSGATPTRIVTQTPNPLATPSSSTSSLPASSVPASPISQLATTNVAMAKQMAARVERARIVGLREQLAASLDSLPRPRNLVEISAPGVVAVSQDSEPEEDIPEDAADAEARCRDEVYSRLQTLKRVSLSTTARRGLPRPSPKPVLSREPTDAHEEIAQLVAHQVALLVRQDAVVLDALKGAEGPVDKVSMLLQVQEQLQGGDQFTAAELQDASSLIDKEFEVMGTMCDSVPPADGHGRVFLERISRYVDPSEPELHDEAHQLRHEEMNRYTSSVNQQAEAIERNVKVLTAGLQKRRSLLLGQLRQSHDRVAQISIELVQFRKVETHEKQVGVDRLAAVESRHLASESRRDILSLGA